MCGCACVCCVGQCFSYMVHLGGDRCVRLQLYWTKSQALSQWDECACVCAPFGVSYILFNKYNNSYYQLVNNECLLHKFSRFKCVVCVFVFVFVFVIVWCFLLIKCIMYDQLFICGSIAIVGDASCFWLE